jgi:hypothetical protein
MRGKILHNLRASSEFADCNGLFVVPSWRLNLRKRDDLGGDHVKPLYGGQCDSN